MEEWWADGWQITQGLVRDVEKRDGLYRVPGKRGGNVTIAAQAGDLWRAKKHGAGTFVLNLWLGGSSRAEVEGYWDDLIRAVTPGHRLVRFGRRTAGGQWRYCLGEVVSAMEPTPHGQVLMRCSVEVSVPSGKWQTATQVSDSGPADSTVWLNAFSSSTAPLDDLIYRITGPITAPTVHDVTDVSRGILGERFTWTGVVGAGQTLIVDSGRWAVAGEGGMAVPHVGPLSYTGDRFLTVPIAPPGEAPAVQLTGFNVGGGAGLTVTGRPAYAV